MKRLFSTIPLLFVGQVFASEPMQCFSSYQLKVTTQTEFEFKNKSVTRHKMNGYLSMRPYLSSDSVIEDATWWGIQLTEITQVANGNPVPEDHIYHMPFAVLRGDNGQLLDFKFPADIDEEAQSKLKGLAYYLQFAPKEIVAPQANPRQEIDTIGHFQAKYDWQEIAAVDTSSKYLEVSKEKLNYKNFDNVTTNAGASNPLSNIDVLDSKILTQLNTCWFEQTRGREKLKISSDGGGYQMTTSQSYSIFKLDHIVDALLWQMPEDIHAWKLKEEKELLLSDEELKLLAAKLRQDLQSIDYMSMRGSELGAWLQQYEAVISTVGEMLLEGVFDDKQQMRIFNALGQMDTDNGNRLLVDLMSEEALSETNRFRAMRAITNGTSPLTPELTEQMLDLLQDENFPGSDSLRGSAIMALGAVVQRRKSNEHSEQLLTELTNKLTAATNENEKAALVASLGNSTKPRVVDTLKSYTADSSARVRANAATSLGQVGNTDAHKALSGMLSAETDARAQQAVLGAIGQFELSNNDIDKVADIASKSKSERTRGNAIKALGNQTHQPEQAQQKLRELMKIEKSRKNFTLAAKSLTALKNQNSQQQQKKGG